jgi:phage tail protein X
MSCVSTNLTEEQKDVLLAFEQVYDSYKTNFILDDAQTYTVVEGDTLPAIVRRFYGAGNGYFFPLILLASRDVVLDADFLESGMVLTIPDLQKNLDNPDTRRSLKYFLYDAADVYEKREAAETQEYKKQLAENLKNRLRSQADSL